MYTCSVMLTLVKIVFSFCNPFHKNGFIYSDFILYLKKFSLLFHEVIAQNACLDPDRFVRGGSTLTTFFLVDEGRKDPNTTLRGFIIPPGKCHLNGVLLACR